MQVRESEWVDVALFPPAIKYEFTRSLSQIGCAKQQTEECLSGFNQIILSWRRAKRTEQKLLPSFRNHHWLNVSFNASLVPT